MFARSASPKRCLNARHATEALTAAVIQAVQWCDLPANKTVLVAILRRLAWFNVLSADISPRLNGLVEYDGGRIIADPQLSMKFWRNHASYPFQSHDLWLLIENIRWAYWRRTPTRARWWRRSIARMCGVPRRRGPAC